MYAISPPNSTIPISSPDFLEIAMTIPTGSDKQIVPFVDAIACFTVFSNLYSQHFLNGEVPSRVLLIAGIGAPCENAGAQTPYTIDKAIKVPRIFNIDKKTEKLT